MALSQQKLRTAANRSYKVSVAKSLHEAKNNKNQTAFLCHSHKDSDLAKGLQTLLKESGWDVYIDWQDNELPAAPSKETANKIKSRITETDWFLFLATSNSTSSRWCPWEIGFADAVKNLDNILIIPTSDINGKHFGNEYLQLYKKVDEASNQLTGKSGYAVFKPNTTSNGTWVDSLTR